MPQREQGRGAWVTRQGDGRRRPVRPPPSNYSYGQSKNGSQSGLEGVRSNDVDSYPDQILTSSFAPAVLLDSIHTSYSAPRVSCLGIIHRPTAEIQEVSPK